MRKTFSVPREQLRAELAVDLAKGGYVFVQDDCRGRRYFDKYLVLTRPGLVARCAELLVDLLPHNCEALAVTAPANSVLGAVVAQKSGFPLLVSRDDGLPAAAPFGGEAYSGIRCALIEDVIFTGNRALAGAKSLSALGASVVGVVCLLDRQAGGALLLAEADYPLRSLFSESDLLAA